MTDIALPLAGLKICDLMWVMAGPAATRLLADFGATVVRIETPTRPDPARGVSPHARDERSLDTSLLWHNNNANKLGVSLDLSKPAAKQVFLDLVKWADVVTESFSPGTMDDWGLGYETLTRENPSLIMLSTCLMGQDGPWASLAGFGNLSAGVTGFYGLCGWEDRPPAGPFGAYTDYVAPRYVALAILAALDHRRRSGRGQYIDLAQAEASIHFLAAAFVDQSWRDSTQSGLGNFDTEHCPHGVYLTKDNRWLAIACRTDSHWAELCAALGADSLLRDTRFATRVQRQDNRRALDDSLTPLIRAHAGATLDEDLRQRRVPASLVQDSRLCMDDPQLNSQGHFVTLPHPTLGKVVVEGPRFELSRTPGRVRQAAPLLSQHDELVLRDFLGYDQGRIQELRSSGVIASGQS